MPVQQFQFNALNPLAIDAQVEQNRTAQMGNALNALKMDEYHRGVNRQNSLNALLASNADATTLRKSGFMKEAADWEKSQADVAHTKAQTGETTRKAEKARYETMFQHFDAVERIMSGVRDQATLDQAIQQAAQVFGPEHASKINPVYNPQAIAQAKAQAMSLKDRLEQEWKQKNFDLDVRQQGEVERHNRTSEGLSAGNLAVSRERLALDRTQPRGQFIETPEGFMLADPRTGKMVPAVGPSGQPVRAKAATEKPLTETQGNATGFGMRAIKADKIIQDLEAAGALTPSIVKQGVENIPLVGGALGAVANYTFASPEEQQVEQAQRDFINAILRKESGAAIGADEFANARKQYFNQPGDDKAVRAQKAANRKTAIEALRVQAGPGARSIDSAAPAAAQQTAPASGGGIKFLGFE